MKPSEFTYVSDFLAGLDGVTAGSAMERTLAISVMRRTLTHIQEVLANENKQVRFELTELAKDESKEAGFAGIAAKDECYECVKSGYRRGVLVVIRDMENKQPLRSVVLILSDALCADIFGKDLNASFALKNGKKVNASSDASTDTKALSDLKCLVDELKRRQDDVEKKFSIMQAAIAKAATKKEEVETAPAADTSSEMTSAPISMQPSGKNKKK